MKKNAVKLILFLFTGLMIAIAIWGPEIFSRYRDRTVLDEIHIQTVEASGEGYRYTLTNREKLSILSRSLSSQTVLESEQSALSKAGSEDAGYQKLTGTYAFIVNHRGPSETEITNEEIFETCNRELDRLKGLGILPEEVRPVEADSYDTVLYSAIDVLEPRNNVAVWKVSLSDSRENRDKTNRLIDAYVDADTGKLYEFYIRIPQTWEELDPDTLIDKWSGYLEVDTPAAYEVDNPLVEITPYFKKYVFAGTQEEQTVVTVGFFEGINELFLKISQ